MVDMGDLVVRCRATALLAALCALSVPALRVAGPFLADGPPGLHGRLVVGLAWLLLTCLAWLWAAALVMAAEALLTGATGSSAPFAPRVVRTLVTALCGAGLAAGLAGPVAAEPVDRISRVHVLEGLPLPDRAVDGPAVDRLPAGRGAVTVRRGDTLWALAQERGLDWQSLYRANRAVVGADPDLIHPGMRLEVPHDATRGSKGR